MKSDTRKHNILFTWLKYLDIEPVMDTFHDRKRMQKLVFLIQEFGVDQEFYYNWYLQGPYSPQLTRTIYDVLEIGIKPKIIDINENTKSMLDKFEKAIGDDYKSVDALELLASLQYLRKTMLKKSKNITQYRKEVIDLLREKKPHFSKRQIEYSWLKLDSLNL